MTEKSILLDTISVSWPNLLKWLTSRKPKCSAWSPSRVLAHSADRPTWIWVYQHFRRQKFSPHSQDTNYFSSITFNQDSQERRNYSPSDNERQRVKPNVSSKAFYQGTKSTYLLYDKTAKTKQNRTKQYSRNLLHSVKVVSIHFPTNILVGTNSTAFITHLVLTSYSYHFFFWYSIHFHFESFHHAFLPLSTLLSLDAFLSFPIISCISHFVHLPFLSITIFPIFQL